MRIIDDFKMERAIKKIIRLMEEEEVNIAEAEAMPKYLESAIKRNNEKIEKGKPFVVSK